MNVAVSQNSTPHPALQWVSSSESEPFVAMEAPSLSAGDGTADVAVLVNEPRQRIDGFGASFNELGWDALQDLTDEDRTAILRTLFEPGAGANLTLCRMPIGANDFSRDWYSYDEHDGDFSLEHFTVANDHTSLIPFINAAKMHQTDLRLWASPWSPPTWMKTNKHYAAARVHARFGIENGLGDGQEGQEGVDLFRMDEPYLRAYAAYFGRFIDAYRNEGIDIEMVMPQNEFNSPQIFPSCPWTPEGMTRFLGHLGPEMSRRKVSIFLGTLERSDAGLVERILHDPAASMYVSGLGAQWAGRGAVAVLNHRYPQLPLYQTEQECGDGRNDWRHARHAWAIMKQFFTNGASAYMYWNMALRSGGVSRWGWAQNSLVVVDPIAKTYEYTHEYHLLTHVSRFVRTDARHIPTLSHTGHENQIAFKNPDGSLVIVAQNDLTVEMPIRYDIGGRVLSATLPADSFNTFVVPADDSSAAIER